MIRGGKIGWFLGLIFGTLFGVMFAPRKGEELRKKIKAERKKGKLGFAPLQDDMKKLGEELVSVAREIYDMPGIQDIVERGRAKMKNLSSDFVDEVTDFHVTRIAPIEKRVKRSLRKFRGGKKKR